MPVHLKDSLSYQNPLRGKFPEDFFKGITQTSGVYYMLGPRRSILYIGKAKNLRARIASYARAKPGQVSERILEMIESVHSIHWDECESEKDALLRETQLLHAIRPPFNVAQTEVEHYLFLGTRESRIPGSLSLDFKLSSYNTLQKEGYQVYGCFNHRRRIKAGYTALLRLVYAALFQKHRFSYPARITRVFPPWIYTCDFPKEWRGALDRYLSGSNMELLHLLFDCLLNNEFVPTFMRPSIQEDIETVKVFYQVGPQATFKLKKRHGISDRVLSHEQMDQLILNEVTGGAD